MTNYRIKLLAILMSAVFLSNNSQSQQPLQDIKTTINVFVPEADVKAVTEVLDTFIVYFRQPLKENLEKHLSTYLFPHVRIASGAVSITPVADSISAETWLAKLPSDWDHSAWVSRDIVQASPLKIHVLTVFRRFRKDNTVIADEHSLYILEKVNGKWGIRGRSSFAK